MRENDEITGLFRSRLAGAEKTGININFCQAKTPSSKQFSFQ